MALLIGLSVFRKHQNMLPLFYVFLLFFVATVSGYEVGDENNNPIWPEKYSFNAIEYDVTLGIVTKYQFWRTNISSRMDYNDGTVKSIRKKQFRNSAYGFKCEIHPEFTPDQINIVSINVTILQDNNISLSSMMPFVDNLVFDGYDSIDDKEVLKYHSKVSNIGHDVRRNLWAMFNNETRVWSPVRWEIRKNSERSGSFRHVIIYYYGFVTDFDESVFDIADPPYHGDYTMSTMDSEAVTKYLLFIDPENEEHVDHVFNVFKREHNKEYHDEIEHSKRKILFQNNMRLIKSTNYKKLGYKLAVNQFSDRTPEEMERYTGLWKNPGGISGNIPFPYTDSQIGEMEAKLPDEYDMRLLGYVSSVKNQGSCASCWAFAATAAMEGSLARSGGKLITLSTQALIDCAWPFTSNGCGGAPVEAAYAMMLEYGIPTEEEYGSYLANDDFCRISNMTVKYRIKGYTDIITRNVTIWKVLLVNDGPLVVHVYASPSFHQYKGGIFHYDTNCSSNVDHGVVLVGYGTRDGQSYWILKNSWGPNWGLGGYILMSTEYNNCSIKSPTFINMV